MHGDARRHAASIIQHLKRAPLTAEFCCYGTQHSVHIGIGRQSSLALSDNTSFDALWADINQFIESHKHDYIFGFIGFDPSNMLDKNVHNYQRKIDLFVPDTVIECDMTGCTVVRGNADIEHDCPPTDNADAQAVDITALDHTDMRERYAGSVATFIQAINNGVIERATLARKIDSPIAFDLAATFISDSSRHALSRSFYFSNQQISFAGQSPELLAEGNTASFATHKLSGTYALVDGVDVAERVARFRADHRIVSEHHSSIQTIRDSLAAVGSVRSREFDVMELPTLIHGWSEFITRPTSNKTVADCLRSIFPFGVNPVKPGFKLLEQHEDFCRGPYYGLTGCIRPGGEFSFTQVLRSAFADKHGSYLMAGAAITQHSTPELEVAETCSKLLGVEVFARAAD